MRALVQRVTSATVSVDSAEVSRIDAGMLVLLGVARGDGPAEADRMARKLLALRIFEDSEGRIGEPLGGREILCVSQFTLLGDVRKGNRPSFIEAAEPQVAKPLWERVCADTGAKRGSFGARMAVELVNDGPLTLLVEVAPRS